MNHAIADLFSIPRLQEAQNVLVIFPHPDDAELVAGGTVRLLAEQGATVTYAAVTDGNMGTFDPSMARNETGAMRRKEQDAAAAILGVKEVVWLGFNDGFLPEVETVRQGMVKVIRRVRPDFVITLDPWLPYEGHPDHRKTGLAAVEACMYASFPLAYPEHMSDGLTPWGVTGIALGLSPKPNTYIGIDSTWEKKIRACLCHESQFPEPVWNALYLPYIQAKCSEWGQQAGEGIDMAESFKVLSPHHLHVMVDTWLI